MNKNPPVSLHTPPFRHKWAPGPEWSLALGLLGRAVKNSCEKSTGLQGCGQSGGAAWIDEILEPCLRNKAELQTVLAQWDKAQEGPELSAGI